VEGMAAGCVPVVIGKGGQPEIVRHGQNGFLWESLEELKSYTLKLIQDESLRRRIAKNALADSVNYSNERFKTRLGEILNDIGVKL